MGWTNGKMIETFYDGKRLTVSPALIASLGMIKDRVEHNWDAVILVTGDVGSGKSSIAKTLAGLYQKMRSESLSLDNFTWHSEGLIEFTERDDNEQEPLIFDEAIQGGTGKDLITKQGKELLNVLVTKRRKRHVLIVIIDQLQEFNRKFISRCALLIDCRTQTSGGREHRGFFKMYNKDQVLQIYTLLKKGIIRDIRQYKDYGKPFYRFNKCDDIFVNEEEYEKKKIEETNRLLDEGESKIKWSQEKLSAFAQYIKYGYQPKELAEKLDMNHNTMRSWYMDFKRVVVS